MTSHLEFALKSVNWSNNLDILCSAPCAPKIERCVSHIALWSSQIELIEKDNIALPFIREMQRGGHNVAACLALALYKPAASSMRALLECALYYTYFRTHSAELKTLVSNDKFYISKKEITEFYKLHVANFRDRQNSLNLSDRLEKWYSKTSSIVHGQIPGEWTVGVGLGDTVHDLDLLDSAADHFVSAVKLVNDVFICVLAEDLWRFLDKSAKEVFLEGMSGSAKQTLGLDSA